jgi:hypothetical protein
MFDNDMFATLPADTLCNPDPVAKYYGVTERTLADWRRAGSGPPYIRCGHKTIRYLAGSVRDYAHDSQVASTSQESAVA